MKVSTSTEHKKQKKGHHFDKRLEIGMAIPRRISLLEESRNGKIPFLGDRGK